MCGLAVQVLHADDGRQNEVRAAMTIALKLELGIGLLARQHISRFLIITPSHCQGAARLGRSSPQCSRIQWRRLPASC